MPLVIRTEDTPPRSALLPETVIALPNDASELLGWVLFRNCIFVKTAAAPFLMDNEEGEELPLKVTLVALSVASRSTLMATLVPWLKVRSFRLRVV